MRSKFIYIDYITKYDFDGHSFVRSCLKRNMNNRFELRNLQMLLICTYFLPVSAHLFL